MRASGWEGEKEELTWVPRAPSVWVLTAFRGNSLGGTLQGPRNLWLWV